MLNNIFSFCLCYSYVKADKLGEMSKIMGRNDKHLELHVKSDGRFKPVSKEIIDNLVNQDKKEYKEARKNSGSKKEQLREWLKLHIASRIKKREMLHNKTKKQKLKHKLKWIPK